ncbi:rho GTPase-activating protein 19-like protein [Sarcoptes scabiei]|uniref:Rho GTPase-activating protein 19-like protein n=1 Tax=Sarcoptes scabiei TaxID=52283 RepID=A0A132AEX8_SARSC|nr:rho GTPase-activating protein 19-like protein [Sarcoptes scabiei]
MADLDSTLQKVFLTSELAYRELIKVHLSRLIEIDSGFDFDRIYQTSTVHADTIFGANLTQEGICSINQLIVYISKKDNLKEKGIFRISGLKSRQVKLENLICSGQTIEIDSKEFTVHDCCCVLKRFISELPHPLLTEQLQKLFLKTIHLEESKRLDANRLLILLLPDPNRFFLCDLLFLFEKIVDHSKENLMTESNISTIFAPNLFRIPNNHDSHIGCKKLEFEADTTNLSSIPAAKFCSSIKENYSTRDYTEMQLAELYAQVQSMAAQSPAIKKKFLKKFNQNKNGFGTPMLQRDKQQQELIKQSLKKSASTRKKNESHIKSLGAAIKKKLLSTPNPDKTKLTPKSTPKTPDLKNTINSSVPIDEEFAAKHRVVINELKKLDKISPERSKFGSRIPVAIISPNVYTFLFKI